MYVQVCMVTGAARGLGNEFCRAFIQSCVNSLSLLSKLSFLNRRGCTKLAIVDLNKAEAEAAAEELTAHALDGQ